MAPVADTPENVGRCLCGECPSKPSELKTLYCSRGKSSRPAKHRGCLCDECDVQVDHDLEGSYYCESGAA